MKKLTGHEAIEAKRNNPDIIINKYNDPTEGEKSDIDLDFAIEVASEDASLIWCEVW